MRGRLVSCGQMSPQQVDALEWWQALDLLAYWRAHPPLRDLVDWIARFCGYKPPAAPASPDPADPSGLGALIRDHPTGKVRVDGSG